MVVNRFFAAVFLLQRCFRSSVIHCLLLLLFCAPLSTLLWCEGKGDGIKEDPMWFVVLSPVSLCVQPEALHTLRFEAFQGPVPLFSAMSTPL